MAIVKRTTFSESNINTSKNTSSLTINVYFSANNSETWFQSATLSCTCNGSTQSKTVSHPVGGSSSASFTFNNIAHNNDGSKSVSWSWKCPTGTYTLGTVSASGTQALTKINRGANITSAVDFNDEGSPTIKYNNPGKFRLNARLEFAPANGSGFKIIRDNISNTGSYTFNFTEAERTLLRQKCTGTSMAVREVIATCYSGSTEAYWSYVDKKMNMVNANPIFSNFEYEDSNSSTLAITGDSSKIIKGYSTLRITIDNTNKATALKEATMKYYLINNVQYAYQDNFSVDIPDWNSDTVTVTAVDSRGLSTNVTKTLTVASYNPLSKTSGSILRDGNVSDETQLSYSGSITSVLPNGNNNTITATYKYKKTEDSSYTNGTTNITPSSSNNNFSFADYIVGDIPTGFEINNSYDVVVTVQDVLSTITYSFVLSSGIPAMSVKGNNVAIHGGYDEQLGGTQINGNLFLNSQLMATHIIESGGSWNTNYYVKYSNGIMVQWGEAIFTDAITTGYNGWYRPSTDPTKTLVKAFKNNQYILQLTGVGGYISFAYIGSRSADSFRYWPIASWSINNSNNKVVHFIAVGYWK